MPKKKKKKKNVMSGTVFWGGKGRLLCMFLNKISHSSIKKYIITSAILTEISNTICATNSCANCFLCITQWFAM